MSKKYSYLLFDLDNTLVDDDENRKYAISQILIERNEKATKEKVEEFINIDNKFWKDRACGKIKDPYEFKTKEEKTEWVRAQRFIKYFKNITLEDAKKINEKYINLVKEKVIPIENAIEVLKYLYEKKYEIYIITNGPTLAVDNKLEKSNMKKYITNIFSADEVGHMKPRVEYFEGFFKKINNNEKEKMLIIGDDLEQDILGGLQNQIDTCWFNPKKLQYNKCRANYEIENLKELKNIL